MTEGQKKNFDRLLNIYIGVFRFICIAFGKKKDYT